jgi:hypothetical protein
MSGTSFAHASGKLPRRAIRDDHQDLRPWASRSGRFYFHSGVVGANGLSHLLVALADPSSLVPIATPLLAVGQLVPDPASSSCCISR